MDVSRGVAVLYKQSGSEKLSDSKFSRKDLQEFVENSGSGPLKEHYAQNKFVGARSELNGDFLSDRGLEFSLI